MGGSYEVEQRLPKISVVMPVLATTPFLQEMTDFAIRAHRTLAARPFELIIVEAGAQRYHPENCHVRYQDDVKPDIYFDFNPGIGGIKESNKGIDAATGDFILLTGTDVIPPQGWDVELLRIFELIPDCGVASLSAFEPNATIGPPAPLDLIVEGMFSPFMMIRNGQGWRWDESFERMYQDSDLVLRQRQRGLHPYRSCRAHVWHLGSVTNKQASEEHRKNHERALRRDERTFYERWSFCPYATFAMMRGGIQQYGREHEAYTSRINLHYDPSKTREEEEAANGG